MTNQCLNAVTFAEPFPQLNHLQKLATSEQRSSKFCNPEGSYVLRRAFLILCNSTNEQPLNCNLRDSHFRLEPRATLDGKSVERMSRADEQQSLENNSYINRSLCYCFNCLRSTLFM